MIMNLQPKGLLFLQAYVYRQARTYLIDDYSCTDESWLKGVEK